LTSALGRTGLQVGGSSQFGAEHDPCSGRTEVISGDSAFCDGYTYCHLEAVSEIHSLFQPENATRIPVRLTVGKSLKFFLTCPGKPDRQEIKRDTVLSSIEWYQTLGPPCASRAPDSAPPPEPTPRSPPPPSPRLF